MAASLVINPTIIRIPEMISKSTDKASQKFRIVKAYFLKPSRPSYGGKKEFLNSLGQKHCFDHQPDDDGRFRIVCY